ncbi:MAG: prepilin peptidase [Betaproteobacteria bacterium]|nr:prepilin peptidase [Betaproteobacteria bacterium]
MSAGGGLLETPAVWASLAVAGGFVAGFVADRLVDWIPHRMAADGRLPEGVGRLRAWRRGLPFLCAALSLAGAMRFGPGWPALAVMAFLWALLVLVFIDLETQLLPDLVTLPLLWAGLLSNSWGLFTDLHAALWGAAGGYLLLWSVYWLYRGIARREGIGRGDFKLLAALGAWTGWESLPSILLFAALAGVIVGGIWLSLGQRSRHTPIPFGPFLAAAGYGVMLWGKGGMT